MSELTPEEKKKIYEEERERLRVQEEIKKEGKKPKPKKTLVKIIILSVFMVSWLAICGVFDKTEDVAEPDYIILKASISFDGSQFTITNNDSFHWLNVEMEINSGLLRGGYKLKSSSIIAGRIYTVGSMQFTKSSGEKFNPFSMKPLNFSIICDTPRGRGTYMVEWE